MTKDEALDLALEAAYLAGFNASGEGYNGEYPFRDHGAHPEQDAGWIKNRDKELTAIKQARSAPVQEQAEQLAKLGWQTIECPFCGSSGAQAFPKPAAQPAPVVQEPVAWVDLLKQAEEVVRSKSLWKKYIDGTPLANDIAVWMASFAQEHTTPQAAQPAPVQEPVPDYAWPTVADYEKDVGFEVNDAFKMAWAMARTTNDLFTQKEKRNG